MSGNGKPRSGCWLAGALLLLWSGGDVRVPASEPPQRSVSIAFVGDLMCHKPQMTAAYNSRTRSYDFDPTFDAVRAELERADIAIGNLETTLPGNPRQYRGFPLFGVDDAFAAAVRRAGIDVLATANNHCLDTFEAGLLRTIKVTRELGFHQLGTYASAEDHRARRVLILEKNGLRVAVLNYTYSTNGIDIPDGVVVNLMDEERIIADLACARSMKPDATLVVFHWGWEYNRYPNSQQKRFAKLSFEHGADVVLGAHPHVVQPFELQTVTDIYGATRDCLVLYSAGNFLSNQQRSHTKGGIIFHFDLVRQEGRPLAFANVRHTPTWVYRGYSRGKRFYKVLPAAASLSQRSVPGYEKSRMRSHLASTDKLLAKGHQSLDAYYARGGVPQIAAEPIVAAAKSPPLPRPEILTKTTPAPPTPEPLDPEAAASFKPGGAIQVTARLTAKPPLDGIDPRASGNLLGGFEYAVVSVGSGDYPLPKIRVADGLVVGRKLTRSARRELGDVVQFRLVPLDRYPALKRWKFADVAEPEASLPLYTPKLR